MKLLDLTEELWRRGLIFLHVMGHESEVPGSYHNVVHKREVTPTEQQLR